MNWLEKTSLDINEILQVLPHRFPFLLVDRVLDIRPGKPIYMGMPEHEAIEARKGTICRTIKNVTINEPQFQGHFPNNPISPGVLTIEALAQSATFAAIPFVALSHGGKLPPLKVALAGFDEVRFRKPIVPGDQMAMTITVRQTRGPIWSFDGLVEVDGKKVAEGKLLAQLLFGEG